nr:GntR family transcriptional regulator [uncultured Cupriavidus sp.]
MARETKRNLAEEIAKALAEGAYRPGEWLRQIDLEQSFGASRFDVRKALEQLVARKLMEHMPNRGYRVSEPDTDTLRHVREVRAILEAAAAAEACQRISEESIKELEDSATRFEEAAKAGRIAEQSQENQVFHRQLYAACANPVLLELIWSMRARAGSGAVTVWPSYDALVRSAEEHREMIAALRERDGARIHRLVQRHVLKADAGVRMDARAVADGMLAERARRSGPRAIANSES